MGKAISTVGVYRYLCDMTKIRPVFWKLLLTSVLTLLLVSWPSFPTPIRAQVIQPVILEAALTDRSGELVSPGKI